MCLLPQGHPSIDPQSRSWKSGTTEPATPLVLLPAKDHLLMSTRADGDPGDLHWQGPLDGILEPMSLILNGHFFSMLGLTWPSGSCRSLYTIPSHSLGLIACRLMKSSFASDVFISSSSDDSERTCRAQVQVRTKMGRGSFSASRECFSTSEYAFTYFHAKTRNGCTPTHPYNPRGWHNNGKQLIEHDEERYSCVAPVKFYFQACSEKQQHKCHS